MDSLVFLDRAAKAPPQPVYALVGDEDFLKRQVQLALQKAILGEDDFGLSVHDGATATYGAVSGDVQTVALLGPRRLVVVENADEFVKRERARLEKYVAAPAASGVLVLHVGAKTWAPTTKLAKALPDAATIQCVAPHLRTLPRWCVNWCKAVHGKDLAADASQLLTELIGDEMGRLDQELAKLAAAAGTATTITLRDVDRLVGRGRSEAVWKILDHIGAGKVGPAVTLLGQLLDMGEEPLRLLGAISSQLRRLVQAVHMHDTGKPLGHALDEAGVLPFARHAAEQQIRHLGRRRIDRVYEWLQETDLGIKSSKFLPPRTLLERLVIRLARPIQAH